MILPEHIPYYAEIFRLPGFLSGRTLCFGFQDIQPGALLGGRQYPNLEAFLRTAGVSASSLDLFDGRAALRYDMNDPVPPAEHQQYRTLIDVGSLEHVFDTRQCLENCMRMVAVGGYYMLHTPVNGYCGHGLHVFNPLGLLAAFRLNGFRVIYRKYSSRSGVHLADPRGNDDAILWLVGARLSNFDRFTAPNQHVWSRRYATGVTVRT